MTLPIVERLREAAGTMQDMDYGGHAADARKGADTIEQLYEALEPFAKEADRFADLNLSDKATLKIERPVKWFRSARAARDKARGAA